jgi:DNA-binding beta-propeller fold protein YncE
VVADGSGDAPVGDGSLESELADARATVASLQAEVEDLEARPPSALDANSMRRVVIGSEVNFISARDDSIAVVGTFGGLSLIDPETNRVILNGNISDSANRALRTDSSVWITDYQGNQIIQVDPGTNTVKNTFPFPGPDGIAKVGDELVVASFDGEFVAMIDPYTGQIAKQVDVGGRPSAVHYSGTHGLWVAVFDTGEIVRLTRSSLETNERVQVGANPVGIGADGTHLWITNNGEGTVAKFDSESMEVVDTIAVGEGPAEIVSVGGSAWVTVSDDGTLVQIDAATGRIMTVTPLGGAIPGGGPTGIGHAAGALWIAMQGEQSVVKIEL